jgi:hypothetical protein
LAGPYPKANATTAKGDKCQSEATRENAIRNRLASERNKSQADIMESSEKSHNPNPKKNILKTLQI